MSLLVLLNLILLTTALPHSPPSQYVGCISTPESSSTPFSTTTSLSAPFTAAQCLQACAGKAALVAIGGGSCFCDDGSGTASASFELVDEARCGVVCVPGDESSGKCGGEGVLSLYQISGSDCDCKKNLGVNAGKNASTVPPVVQPSPCPPEGCNQPSTPIPTPAPTPAPAPVLVTQAQQQAAAPCPPEGCQSTTRVIVTVTTPLPASNSTGSACPSGSCAASNQAGAAQTPTSSGGQGAGGQGAGEAPGLANESPRLYTSGILSSIAAIIFGLSLL
ncbi:hypothetical protein NW762_013069 [Fusarium torreyae]|uniref:WSC domain-containing protein n=1 Tax=Fusarium torreyae TaxID=1237075 RepID=A0A9W8RPK5_9HYPO|nr:hypothetical protein NW762_013069 [Fusarium torreyae]